jgi:hypothetical protein
MTKSEAREEREGMHLSGTVVLLPARLFYRGTPKHYSVVKCTTDLFFVSLAKAEMARNAAFIPVLEREGPSAAEIGK